MISMSRPREKTMSRGLILRTILVVLHKGSRYQLLVTSPKMLLLEKIYKSNLIGPRNHNKKIMLTIMMRLFQWLERKCWALSLHKRMNIPHRPIDRNMSPTRVHSIKTSQNSPIIKRIPQSPPKTITAPIPHRNPPNTNRSPHPLTNLTSNHPSSHTNNCPNNPPKSHPIPKAPPKPSNKPIPF